MWNTLTIQVTENGINTNKILFYDSCAFRDERQLNTAISNLLDKKVQYNAFIVDELVNGYITKICDEAMKEGIKRGRESIKLEAINVISKL